jgi:hypothetical protein
MYVPLNPETIMATPLVSITLMTDAGVVIPLSHEPMTTPRLVIAPSKAFMAKYRLIIFCAPVTRRYVLTLSNFSLIALVNPLLRWPSSESAT